MNDFLNLFENNPQIVDVSYSMYPESFFSAKITIDPTLKKVLSIGLKTDTEINILTPGGEKEVKKLSIDLYDGDESIGVVLTKSTAKSLLLILNQIYKNLSD